MKQSENSPQEQALLAAAEQGDTEQVRQLLDKGVAIDCRDRYLHTPLILAAQEGHLATTELLLQRGAGLEARDEWDKTPFLAACRSGSMPLIRLLLAAGANAYAEDEEDNRALYYADHHDSPELVDMLAPFSDLPKEEWYGGGGSALAHACYCGHLNAAKRMLEWGISPNARGDCSSQAVLAYACHSGNLELVRLLLECGADPAYEDEGEQAICMAMTAKPFNPAVAELMLQLGNDINCGRQKWQTPLEQARQYGTPEAVEWALAHGAKEFEKPQPRINPAIEVADAAANGLDALRAYIAEHGEHADLNAALLHVCQNGPEQAIAPLLQAGADANARRFYDGRTPLMAAYNKTLSADAVRLLLRYGADPNLQDKDEETGYTPLHWALSTARRVQAEMLMEVAGINLALRDKEGNTPYLIACRKGDIPAAQRLTELGADTHVRDNRGYTALHLAAEHGQSEMVRFLLQEGAEVDAVAKNGFTPLLCACRAEDFRALTEAGANPFHRAHSGWSALIAAVESGESAAAEHILQLGQRADGSNVWARQLQRFRGRNLQECSTPAVARELCECRQLIYEHNLYEDSKRCVSSLTRACSRSDEHAAAVLLEAGVDVNTRDRLTHRTPLFAACSPAGEEVSPALVTRLLAAGADANAVDACGQTPLHALAMLPPSPASAQVKALLLQAGAQEAQQDVFGKTARQYETPLP